MIDACGRPACGGGGAQIEASIYPHTLIVHAVLPTHCTAEVAFAALRAQRNEVPRSLSTIINKRHGEMKPGKKRSRNGRETAPEHRPTGAFAY